ncbi:hypothetical protein VTK73DRAFT_780 [Phialemonium thermophilum]|uniref:Uncharacterized protein n=1 Tax=Phialemonium thermophilum TaxID=223376 RepID=A0ABR3VUA4_9PEZI
MPRDIDDDEAAENQSSKGPCELFAMWRAKGLARSSIYTWNYTGVHLIYVYRYYRKIGGDDQCNSRYPPTSNFEAVTMVSQGVGAQTPFQPSRSAR